MLNNRKISRLMVLFTLCCVAGCGQEPAQSDLPEGLQKREYVSAADYEAASRLLAADNAIAEWRNLSPEAQRSIWPTLVTNSDYPAGSVSLAQISVVDLHMSDLPGEIAWLPLASTKVVTIGAESTVSPNLPQTVSNLVDVTGREGNLENLATIDGINVNAIYDLPRLAQQPVPTIVGEVFYAPVIVYEPIELANGGTAYQYNRLVLFVFTAENSKSD